MRFGSGALRGVLVAAGIAALFCCSPRRRERRAAPDARATPGKAAKPAKQPDNAGDQVRKRMVEIVSPAAGKGGGKVVLARYQTVTLDPVLEELRQEHKKRQAGEQKKTGRIQKASKAEKERKRRTRLVLRSSLPAAARPTSLEPFKRVWHQPPTPQYRAGTCWSYCATSFMESEVHRVTGKSLKLSELASVYWEYVAKAARYVDKRGDSLFAEGSEANAVVRMMRRHGAWPAKSYAGVKRPDGRHDHQRMVREMKQVLGLARSKSIWDRQTVLSLVRVVLDRDLGRPPETFEFQGKRLAPKRFLSEVCRINPDDYVGFISTLEFPFWTRAEFKVPDNWWHDASYHNLPLGEFYGALRGAIKAGFSVVIAIDVSEPGKDPENDVMFVPAYDIPPGRIDQLARELRFAHRSTTDDHGVHLVGWTRHADHDWFLVKDSGRSARHGRHKGYYFVRGDYVRLKVLAFMVHKKAVARVLARFPARAKTGR